MPQIPAEFINNIRNFQGEGLVRLPLKIPPEIVNHVFPRQIPAGNGVQLVL